MGKAAMSRDTVYKVLNSVVIDGTWVLAVTDLIFRDDLPIAVLAWSPSSGGGDPRVSVPLDPAHLSRLDSRRVGYLYNKIIDLPERTSVSLH